jgi:hypothetical protein
VRSVSEELDNVPGLPSKPYVPGNIPWDEFDRQEIEDHIEIMGTLREDIGTFRRLLEKDDFDPGLRILIEEQIILDRRCIEHSMAQIRRLRGEGKSTDERATEGVPGPRQGSFQL